MWPNGPERNCSQIAAGVGQLSVEAGEGVESGTSEPGDETASSVAWLPMLGLLGPE
jgi:hypothetical protein